MMQQRSQTMLAEPIERRAVVSSSAQARCTLVQGLIGARSWPTLLVDGRGLVLSANAPARAFIGANLDWTVDAAGRLSHRHAQVVDALHAHIAALAGGAAHTPAKRAFFVEDADGEQVLVTLTRISAAASIGCPASGCDGRTVMLTILDGRCSNNEGGLALLSELFQFTRAEARLALALLDGLTLQGYADRDGKRISTVRWHLRNALAKTGCANQRDLVRLLMSLLEA